MDDAAPLSASGLVPRGGDPVPGPRCATFWHNRLEQLKTWKRVIEAGRTPLNRSAPGGPPTAMTCALGEMLPCTTAVANGLNVATRNTPTSSALASTFQIYFDFSGYSGMARGLFRMFGLKLPEVRAPRRT